MSGPQKIDPYAPLISSRVGAPPLTMRLGTFPHPEMVMGGVPTGVHRIESYVLLSALPSELQERVKTAIQVLLAGG